MVLDLLNFELHFLQGWSNERVIHMPGVERGRIVMVLDSDSSAHKNKVWIELFLISLSGE